MLRNSLKNREYTLPASIQRLIWPTFFADKNPYSEDNDRLRGIFIHNPKAAGTSITKALFNDPPRNVPAVRYAAFDPKKFKSYYKFGVVRNPWDRLLSGYSYLSKVVGQSRTEEERWATEYLGPYPEFESFVLAMRDKEYLAAVLNNKIFRAQYQWLMLPGHSDHCLDYLARMENIDADFLAITKALGVETQLPKSRVSKHAPYRDAYTPQMVEIAGSAFSRDCKAFGYEY